MSQGPLCPNLTQKVQREVSQMANRNFSRVMLLGGLSVNLNHLKILYSKQMRPPFDTMIEPVQADASLRGLGARLLQEKQPIAFASTREPIRNIVLLAIVFAWRFYLSQEEAS